MFPRGDVLLNAKNIAIILHCRVLGILFGYFSFTRLFLSINFFVASLDLPTSLNKVK